MKSKEIKLGHIKRRDFPYAKWNLSERGGKKGRELNWSDMHIFQSYVSMFTQESQDQESNWVDSKLSECKLVINSCFI